MIYINDDVINISEENLRSNIKPVIDSKYNENDIIENEDIKSLIYTIRGKQVIIDSDVAMLYHYETKNVNKAMKRNSRRFPEDFCFQLSEKEFEDLRFQNGTLNRKVNNGSVIRKYLPYAYTEQGISMLAGVLNNILK